MDLKGQKFSHKWIKRGILTLQSPVNVSEWESMDLKGQKLSHKWIKRGINTHQ
jgi:hypothetical protein